MSVGYNFTPVDRDQLMLMPPSVADWLPEDHLAWFVLDVVDELDLSAFLAKHRGDGRGGAAYHPRLMLGLLVYAYCVGERSSRMIEKRLAEDVAFRVVAANQRPDHATIARFRAHHESAIAGVFGQVLAVCARSGLLRPGLVAIDGTKLTANASRSLNRTAEQLAAEILAEAAATDTAETAAESAAAEVESVAGGAAAGSNAEKTLRHRHGRRERLRGLLAELEAEAAEKSYQAHLARRAEKEAATGRPIRGRRPKADSATHKSRRHANVTDPESRLLKTAGGYVQGYNAQAVATTDQFVVAAEVTNLAVDAPAYAPMIAAAKENLKSVGERRQLRRVLADAGYWSIENASLKGVDSFIAPGRARQLKKISNGEQVRTSILEQAAAGQIDTQTAAQQLGVSRARVNQLLRRRRVGEADPLTTVMIGKLDSVRGRAIYPKRAASIEPVFAQIKHNRRIRSVTRRGLAAADSEWKLICATHNLLKLYRLR